MDGSSPDLRGHLAGLLNRTISLDHFQRWLADAARRIEAVGTDDDVDLAARVENRLAEYSGGHIGGDDLRRALAEDFVARYGPIVVIGGDEPRPSSVATVIDP